MMYVSKLLLLYYYSFNHFKYQKLSIKSFISTWLIEGCPLVFLFEVVSSPQREENRLRRLLKVRGMAWFLLLMLLSVRADTC